MNPFPLGGSCLLSDCGSDAQGCRAWGDGCVCVCVCVCTCRWVCTLSSGTLREGTGSFKAFNLEEDRPRSLSSGPGGQMAEQGRMGPKRGTPFTRQCLSYGLL